MNEVIESLRGGLIVSCQAYPSEPMQDPRIMTAVAQSVAESGAVGIRAQGVEDVRLIHQSVRLPQIGLWKVGRDGVFITPTLEHGLAVADAGAEIVAIDGTRRRRPDGLSLAETIAGLHDAGVLVMADASSIADGVAAAEAGADVVGTTLAGYVDDDHRTGPAFDVVEGLVRELAGLPVFAEGRIHTPAQARQALDAGAFAVVVGTAITHPLSIARWFVAAL